VVTTRTGHVITWAAFLLGVLVSIAANVLHAGIGGAQAPELIGSAFWPLALLLSIEVLTRVVWPAGLRWFAARALGLVLVGAVAAILSYRHMAGLLGSWGEDDFNAHIGPLAVDGLMLIAATALLAISKQAQAVEPALVQDAPDTWQPLVVRWRVQLVKLGDLITPAVSADPAVLAYAEPFARREMVTERIPEPEPEATFQERLVDRMIEKHGLPAMLDMHEQVTGVRLQGEFAEPIGPELPPVIAKPKPRPMGKRPSTANTSRQRISERSAGGGQSAARAAWDSAPASGKPSGADLARIAGVDRRTGARWVKAWSSNT
jgi:hypothetical protein